MTANVCGREKKVRTILGIIMILAGLLIGHTVGIIMVVVGAFSVLTALFSYCPINQIAGRNTCRITTPTGRDYINRGNEYLRDDL